MKHNFPVLQRLTTGVYYSSYVVLYMSTYTWNVPQSHNVLLALHKCIALYILAHALGIICSTVHHSHVLKPHNKCSSSPKSPAMRTCGQPGKEAKSIHSSFPQIVAGHSASEAHGCGGTPTNHPLMRSVQVPKRT